MHYIPTFKVDITALPILPLRITAENETAFTCSYEYLYFFAHGNLLSVKKE
jgi:hypothetical protein